MPHKSHSGESKTRDIALYAVCGKGTNLYAAIAAATNRVFLLPHYVPFCHFFGNFSNSSFNDISSSFLYIDGSRVSSTEKRGG